MTIDKDDLLNSILESLSQIDYVKSSDIPNIDLYMDQVTTFIEKELRSSKRYETDKVLTKTMINNYAKNNLLPPPVKKKYSKEHLILLTLIYYFKNILSIKDIETLLAPITEKYFHTDKDFTLSDIYDKVCSFEKSRIKSVQEDITNLYNSSFADTFPDADDSEQESLQLFLFLCTLSFDVYIKKSIIEKIIDSLNDETK